MAVDRFIIIRNVYLEGNNALIMTKKVTNIRIVESQKIKRKQKWKIQLTQLKRKTEIKTKRKFVKVHINNKNIKLQ